jgi:hypothetical protein
MSTTWSWIAGIVVALAIVLLIAFVRENRASRYWAAGFPMVPRVTATQSQVDAISARGAYILHVLEATKRR